MLSCLKSAGACQLLLVEADMLIRADSFHRWLTVVHLPYCGVLMKYLLFTSLEVGKEGSSSGDVPPECVRWLMVQPHQIHANMIIFKAAIIACMSAG